MSVSTHGPNELRRKSRRERGDSPSEAELREKGNEKDGDNEGVTSSDESLGDIGLGIGMTVVTGIWGGNDSGEFINNSFGSTATGPICGDSWEFCTSDGGLGSQSNEKISPSIMEVCASPRLKW